jgi:hypothetical protein
MSAAAISYFREVTASAELLTRDIVEVHRKDAAAKKIGLSLEECVRAFGQEYFEAERADAERCEAAAKKYGINVRHLERKQ